MSSIAPIHFIFGQQREILILYKIADSDVRIFNNSVFLWSILMATRMIELGFIMKKVEFFLLSEFSGTKNYKSTRNVVSK